RDHDGLDAHPSQLAKSLLDAALDDVLELDDAQYPIAIRHEQRRAAASCDFLDGTLNAFGKYAPARFDVFHDGIRSALADLPCSDVHATHAGVRRERDEGRTQGTQIALTQL